MSSPATKTILVSPVPGPWNWVRSAVISANTFHAYIIDGNGRKIAAVWGKGDEKASTAHLMGAAPAMFKAAEALLEKIGHVTGIEPERAALSRALKDAVGEEVP